RDGPAQDSGGPAPLPRTSGAAFAPAFARRLSPVGRKQLSWRREPSEPHSDRRSPCRKVPHRLGAGRGRTGCGRRGPSAGRGSPPIGYPGAVSQSSPIAIGEVLAGKYRIDRVLGEGGMGVVVAAHHLELDQPVAIKFLLDVLRGSEEGAERFRREARAAAKIQSDHVVRVLDVGVLESGIRYMVMEYLEGHDLSKVLEQRG